MALAPTDIKVAGHWKSVDQASIKIGGHWKPVDQIMEKVAGHWKHIGTTLHPPLFTGAIGDLAAGVGEAFTKDVSHLFSTGPVPESYSLNNAPAGMVISNAGVISWPSPVKGDTSGVSVTATNSGGFVVSDAFGVSAIALGPELVVNGDFSTPITFAVMPDYSGHGNEWVKLGDASIVAGELVFPATVASGWVRSPIIHGGTGKTYQVVIDQRETPWLMVSSSDHSFNVSRMDVAKVVGHVETTFVAKTDDFYVYFYRGPNTLAIYDNISVREILP